MAPIYLGTDDLWRAENMLFVFNSIITSFHSNEANSAIVTQLIAIITLNVTWEDILWQMLPCCGLSFFYV